MVTPTVLIAVNSNDLSSKNYFSTLKKEKSNVSILDLIFEETENEVETELNLSFHPAIKFYAAQLYQQNKNVASIADFKTNKRALNTYKVSCLPIYIKIKNYRI
ncbi:MAG: hypothetical protein V4667_09630 [Bacteroidota bacterium]